MKSVLPAKSNRGHDSEIRFSEDYDSKHLLNSKKAKVGFPSMLDSGIAGLQGIHNKEESPIR